MDCLTKNDPWREDDVDRFVYLMNQGEERRSWILNDYKFEDPYHEKWQTETKVKLDSWKEQSTVLTQKTYELNNWLLKSNYVGTNNENSEDDMDNDDDWDVPWNEDENK